MTRIGGTRVRSCRVGGLAAALAVLVGCATSFTPTAESQPSTGDTVSVPLTTVLPTTTEAPTTTTAPIESTMATSAPTTTAVPVTVPTTIAAPVTVPPTPIDGILVRDLLGFITVENEHRDGYVRDLFGYPSDPDGDSCDTRAEVLMSESQSLAQVAQPGCTVVEGDWYSLYDGTMYTTAGELEIDHVVALKEAWDSGAWNWDHATLVAYGNDLVDGRTLRAVSVATNRAKSDKDPSNWIPDNGVCEFLGDWVSVKVRWAMRMDQSEFGRIKNLLDGQCAGTTTAAIVVRN